MCLQGEHAQLTLHVFDIELLLDLLRNPAYKAQQVFEKLVAGNMVTGVQVGMLVHFECLSLHTLHATNMSCIRFPVALQARHIQGRFTIRKY